MTVNSTTTYYNYSPNPYLLVPATKTDQSTSTYEIIGKLGSTLELSSNTDNSVVQCYVQPNGKTKYKEAEQLSIEDALSSSQADIALSGTTNDETLANFIDPSTGNITTTGSFQSTNASSGAIDYWFYDEENNCYASTKDGKKMIVIAIEMMMLESRILVQMMIHLVKQYPVDMPVIKSLNLIRNYLLYQN